MRSREEEDREEEDREEEDREEEGREEEDGEEEDREEEGDIRGAIGSNTISGSTGSSIREIDTMKDARRLYPWPSGLYEIVGRL